MKTILTLACVVLASIVGRGDVIAQQATPAPGFEVISVAPSGPASGGPLGIPTVQPQGDGRFTATNMPVRLLIRMSYGLEDFQIVGGPEWLTSSRFDITVKAPDSSGATAATDLPPLVKSLLADRFKLKAHTETRQLPTYALVVARSDRALGPAIKPSASDCANAPSDARRLAEAAQGGPAALAALLTNGETVKCAVMPVVDPGNLAAGFGLHADGQPLSRLTQLLTQATSRPVSDKTGLQGLYDWDLRFDPQVFLSILSQFGINLPIAPSTNLNPASNPAIVTALQEQLGLALESQQGPVEVLVVDSIEMP